MGFSENLHHMRTVRNMTQEQLAMLLGVSRQAISKWESGQAYPEMDKLVRLRAIFECTLDELVQGDLTEREPVQALAILEETPASDVCDYDGHMRSRAWLLSAGVALMIAVALGGGVLAGGSTFLMIFAGKEDMPVYAGMWLLAGVGIGLALIAPALRSHARFMRRHPSVSDFYTDDDRAKARRARKVGLAFGALALLAGLGFLVLWTVLNNNALGIVYLMCCIALGAWSVIGTTLYARRVDVAAYSRQAERMAEKPVAPRLSAACELILVAATVAGIVVLFVFQQSLFWLAWVFGALACVALRASARIIEGPSAAR